MNSYRSVIIFFLIVLIAAAFWGAIRYFNILEEEQRSPIPVARRDQQMAVIHITDRGFNPQRSEIAKGEMVEFINDDREQHWPASDVHPFHTMCPGFDALRGLKTGERYWIAFTRSQTCHFHDHFNPSLTGVITIQ